MYGHTRTGLKSALKITIRKPFLNDFLEDSLLTEINPLTHKLVGDFHIQMVQGRDYASLTTPQFTQQMFNVSNESFKLKLKSSRNLSVVSA